MKSQDIPGYGERDELAIKGSDSEQQRATRDWVGEKAQAKSRPNRLAERITDAAAEYSERVSMSDGNPDTIPEVARELAMQTGQIDAVFRRFGEVVAMISPVMSASPVKLVAAEVPRAKGPDLATEVGNSIRRNTEMLGDLEDFLVRVREAIRV